MRARVLFRVSPWSCAARSPASVARRLGRFGALGADSQEEARSARQPRFRENMEVLPVNRLLRVFTYLAVGAIAACGGASAPASPPSAPAASASTGAVVADPPLAELRIDYATYSPPSLVLKKQGLIEQAFPGTTIKWVYSAGSSNALNFLQGNAIDFGSTAGSAALLSRANGNPIKGVYIYEQ